MTRVSKKTQINLGVVWSWLINNTAQDQKSSNRRRIRTAWSFDGKGLPSEGIRKKLRGLPEPVPTLIYIMSEES